MVPTSHDVQPRRIRVHRHTASGALVRALTRTAAPDAAGAIEAAWVARQPPGAWVIAEFDNETWIIEESGARQVADDGEPSGAGER